MSTKDSSGGVWQIFINILECLGVFPKNLKGDYVHCMSQILFWVTARMGLDLPNTQSAPIGQLAHAWASTMSTVGSVLFSASSLLQFQHEYLHKLCKCVMSQSHRIKGGTTGEAFQEQCFLWETGALTLADFGTFLTIETFYMHKSP